MDQHIDDATQSQFGFSLAPVLRAASTGRFTFVDDATGELDMSKVTEMIYLLDSFKKTNADATPDDLSDFVANYATTCDDDVDFYINNNSEFDEVFRRIAIQKDAMTNPMKDVETVDERCPKCGGTRALFWQKQTRGSDEPTTNFFKCTNPACNKQWTG